MTIRFELPNDISLSAAVTRRHFLTVCGDRRRFSHRRIGAKVSDLHGLAALFGAPATGTGGKEYRAKRRAAPWRRCWRTRSVGFLRPSCLELSNMNRSLTLTMACLLVSVASLRGADSLPPNVVLILADDLGFGDLRCYNSESKVPTPNLDRMAREGMRFTDMHSPATVCTPTRYSLMTGQMAFRVPRGGTVFTGAGGPSLIAPGQLTLPAMLKKHGYATAAIGKWHVGWTFVKPG